MEMRPFGRLTPALTARSRLLRAASPILREEKVPLTGAVGRVASAPVRAPRAIPPFPRATWDGYAIRSRDTAAARPTRPVVLRVVGEAYAEGGASLRVGPGETVAVATGAPLPDGADTVVIFEETVREWDRLRVRRPVRPGDRLARPGDDFARGTPLAARGEVLGPIALGALAACGLEKVRVYARPVVAVVPNGNELRRAGEPLGPGDIYESNNTILSAVITAAGCVPLLCAAVPDDPRRIEAALRRALDRADVVLATGGSSVGERDYLPTIFPRLGPLLFHGIAVRPGKPTLAARVGRRVLLGLPGHPTSCLANMYWLGLPLLRKVARLPGPGFTEGRARLGADALAPTPGLTTVVPLAFRGGLAYPAFRGSSTVTSLKGATAFALLPPGRRVARAGEELPVFHLAPPLVAATSTGRGSTV
jgi:molybdopterin molybdotransferase